MDAVINRVRKLLALADIERGATEDEAALAAEAAQKLCIKHGIELATISLEEDDNGEVEVENDHLTLASGKWRRTLAHGVAKSMGGQAITLSGEAGYGSHNSVIHIFAAEGTLSSIIYTYRHLESWVEVEAAYATDRRPDPWVHKRTYRTSWINGAVNRIRARLSEAARRQKENAREAGYSTALVRLSTDVEAQYAQAYPNVSKNKQTQSVGDYGAYKKGQAAGDNADIGGAKIDTGRKQIGD